MLGIRPLCRHVRRWYRRRAASDASLSSFHSVESFSSTAAISPRKRPLLSRFLKFGSLATLSATGYVTCAYTRDELKEMTKNFRENNTRSDHPITLGYVDSFIANAKTVSVVAINIYLSYRFVAEEIMQDYFKPPPDKLLPDLDPSLQEFNVITIVLDLNETLVHSDWKRELERDEHSLIKRPGLDAFLERLSLRCELVLFTDELFLDVTDFLRNLEAENYFFHDVLSKRYTTYKDGKRYKDLSKLNRDPSKILYVSGHALENCLQPENCVPIRPWKKEMDDTTLMDILPFLEHVALERQIDVRPILASFKGKDIATECKQYKRRMQELVERRIEERQLWEERRKFLELRKGPWTLS